MPFQKGQSGNPLGRRLITERRNINLEKLLLPHVPKLIKKAVEMGLEGDAPSLRFCLKLAGEVLANPALRPKEDDDDLFS